MSALLLRGDALNLPLADATVDLVVTSPPYFGLRSYTDNGAHYAGQLGSEATPAEFVAALLAATREMVRVLKPSGSIFVNLGDRYSTGNSGQSGMAALGKRYAGGGHQDAKAKQRSGPAAGFPPKTLLGVPWRYALACIDDLGLILRAEIILDKRNGLPESVTDRVRRSHEVVFHFAKSARYYSAVDEVREPQLHGLDRTGTTRMGKWQTSDGNGDDSRFRPTERTLHPLGKLPGSVWPYVSQPFTPPASLGVEHFAAFNMDLPRRIIRGWSPPGVCTACGDGRRPTTIKQGTGYVQNGNNPDPTRLLVKGFNTESLADPRRNVANHRAVVRDVVATITGYACACPTPDAPTRPSVVLDCFGGTGTTALVADALGRTGISVDMSADYCRLAKWRTTDPGQRAAALQVDKPAPVADGQGDLFAEVPA